MITKKFLFTLYLILLPVVIFAQIEKIPVEIYGIINQNFGIKNNSKTVVETSTASPVAISSNSEQAPFLVALNTSAKKWLFAVCEVFIDDKAQINVYYSKNQGVEWERYFTIYSSSASITLPQACVSNDKLYIVAQIDLGLDSDIVLVSLELTEDSDKGFSFKYIEQDSFDAIRSSVLWYNNNIYVGYLNETTQKFIIQKGTSTESSFSTVGEFDYISPTGLKRVDAASDTYPYFVYTTRINNTNQIVVTKATNTNGSVWAIDYSTVSSGDKDGASIGTYGNNWIVGYYRGGTVKYMYKAGSSYPTENKQLTSANSRFVTVDINKAGGIVAAFTGTVDSKVYYSRSSVASPDTWSSQELVYGDNISVSNDDYLGLSAESALGGVLFATNTSSNRDIYFAPFESSPSCNLSLVENNIPSPVPSGGGSYQIKVKLEGTSCTNWYVSDDPSWITLSRTSGGVGTTTVNVTVQSNGGASRNGKIRIKADGAIGSPQEFNVSQEGTQTGDITVTSPSSSTKWYLGQTASVDWDTGNLGGNVKIELYKGNSRVTTLVSSTSNDGSWSTILSTSLTPANDYRVKVTHTSQTSKNDHSEYFEIKNPSNLPPIQVVAPSTLSPGSEFWVEIKVGSPSKPVTNLFGISFVLNYSKTNYVDYVGAESGPFLGSASNLVFQPYPDDTNGKVAIGTTRKSGAGGKSGSGVVAKIKFKIKTSVRGNTTINWSLSEIDARDLNDVSMPLESLPATSEINTGLTVWPGDTDNNNKVDQADVLPLGRYWGQTGPSRDGASNQWSAQTCPPWTPENATYADANGDGKIDQADVLPIGRNWGQTHTSTSSPLPQYKLAKANGVDLTMEIRGDTRPGKEFTIEIKANSVSNLFGISFEMAYSPNSLIDPQSVEAGSWIGNDLVFLPNIDKTNGRIGVGISRKAGQGGINGSGFVAIIRCKAAGSASVGQELALTFHNVSASDPSGNPIVFNTINSPLVVNVNNKNLSAPTEFKLFNNYPNPFNPETTISYNVPKAELIKINVYNLFGQHVKTLIEEKKTPGEYTITWEGEDKNGSSAPTGIYLLRLDAGSYSQTIKMTLIK